MTDSFSISPIRIPLYQSPQEREALQGLTVLDHCVQKCDGRFHQEIGKFRFLNEMIKIVSPKYLGNLTTENVKLKTSRCVFRFAKDIIMHHAIKAESSKYFNLSTILSC